MYLASSGLGSRRAYHALLLLNLAVFAASAMLVNHWFVLPEAGLRLIERLGRAGPLGAMLVVGSLLWAWVDVLVLPTLDARAEWMGRRRRI